MVNDEAPLVAYKVKGMMREIPRIKEEAHRRKEHIETIVAPIENIIVPRKFDESTNTVYIGQPKIVVEGNEYKCTNGALNQALYKLGIAPPFKFFMQKDPSGKMLDSVIEWGIAQQSNEDNSGEKFKIFADNEFGKVHGIMSTKYARVHDSDILEFIDNKMNDTFNNNVKPFTYMNDEKTQITLVSPKNKQLAKVGDTISFGVTVNNSEFGFGALTMSPYFEILRCTNGAIATQVIELARYVHRKVTIFDMFKEAVKDAFAMCEAQFATFERAAGRQPIVDTVEALSDFMYHHGLPKRLHPNILKAAEEEPLPLNGYGIFNHITRAATHYEQDPANQAALLMHAYNFLVI